MNNTSQIKYVELPSEVVAIFTGNRFLLNKEFKGTVEKQIPLLERIRQQGYKKGSLEVKETGELQGYGIINFD